MNMRSKSLAAVTAAAMAVTGLSVPSFAASPVSKPATATPADTASVPTTDFSSRRRYYGYNNNAAAIGAMLAIAGTAAAIAASRNRHRHYYGYGPSPYYGGYGYAPPPGYVLRPDVATAVRLVRNVIAERGAASGPRPVIKLNPSLLTHIFACSRYVAA